MFNKYVTQITKMLQRQKLVKWVKKTRFSDKILTFANFRQLRLWIFRILILP